MKKVLLLLFAIIGLGFVASAQNNAIGVRVGGGQGYYGAEISYQRSLCGIHRLEADLGYRRCDYYDFSSWTLVGVYQLHFDIPAVQNLGWYFGSGAKFNLLTWSEYKRIYYSAIFGVTGQVGVDYHFSGIPLQLSLDFRPSFYLIPYTAFEWGDFALGIRYRF